MPVVLKLRTEEDEAKGITRDVSWTQTKEDISIKIKFPYTSEDKIDIYWTSLYVKVNDGNFLWECDLADEITDLSNFYKDDAEGKIMRLTVTKAVPEKWDKLGTPLEKAERMKRRQQSIEQKEKMTEKRIDKKFDTKQKEKKRYFEEHWDIEKEQRADIVEKVKQEKETESTKLEAWRDQTDIKEKQAREQQSKAEQPIWDADEATIATEENERILADRKAQEEENQKQELPPIRGAGEDTNVVQVDFRPMIGPAPMRGSHDDEYYHQSSYKPKNPQDTPVHYKEQGDTYYTSKQWKKAADSYSEALKRDPAFNLCVCNRAACWLRLHKYEKAISDCNLALNQISNTPCHKTTAERYRYMMMKMYVRRGTAYVWNGQLLEGLDDYRNAMAYRAGGKKDGTEDLALDLEQLEAEAAKRGLIKTMKELTPQEQCKGQGDSELQQYNFAPALEAYTESIQLYQDSQEKLADEATSAPTSPDGEKQQKEGEEEDEDEETEEDKRRRAQERATACYWKAVANRTVCYIQLKQFEEAVKDCDVIIAHCEEVANALNQSHKQDDSDDEEDEEHAAKLRKRDKLLKKNTANVLMLLKAYIRKGSAFAGLKNWPNAVVFYEKALAITPYDDDIRKDIQKLREKMQHELLTTATRMGNK